MTAKNFYAVFLFSFLFTTLNAQVEQVLHQTFSVTDSINAINISIADSVEVEIWGGNKIMTETTILMEGAKIEYLEHFIKNERYKVLSDFSNGILELSSKFPVKNPIKYKDETVFELIQVRVFIPEEFKESDQTRRLVRRD